MEDFEAVMSSDLPDLNESLSLIKEYAVAVSGGLDLFDEASISENVHAWLDDPIRSRWPNCSIFHLVLAIGAQARARGYQDDHFAEQQFIQGRDHAMKSLIDDPSIVTVQAFSLITWYMLTASRRNGATMNLGFAVQAAYALGIHRHEANTSFGPEMAHLRERAWKTLRVCDLFLSASMGRPSITSRIDSNIPLGASSLTDANNRLASAMTRICLIFERILSEVYTKRAVSLELATSISKQHRKWTEALPGMLEADGISPEESPGPVDLSKTLGSAIVVMAYHYSIILLTRPFLTFRVNSHIKNPGSWPDKPGIRPDIITYSDACVTSAINGIGLACDILSYNNMPRRLHLVVNSVFISALVLGLAYFGDYHCHGWSLDQALVQAIGVLQHFGAKSHQAARYQQIIGFLQDATVLYKDKHREDKMKSYNQRTNTVFGNVSAQLDRGRISTIRSNPECQTEAASSMVNSEMGFTDAASSGFGNLDGVLQSSMITTSGKLAPTQSRQEGLLFAQHSTDENGFDTFMDDMLGNTHGDPPFMEDGPLFALMHEYYPI
jgi:hypothetical protein